MALGIIVVLIILSSFMRYGISKPFHFTEEICALLFLSACMFALSHGLVQKKHIKITAIFDLLPDSIRLTAEIFMYLISFIFLTVFLRASWMYAMDTFEFKSVSPDAGIPLWPWMILIPLGTAMFGLNLMVLFVQRVADAVCKNKKG